MTQKSNNSSSNLRFPAEWESHGVVLMAWPHRETDWAYMLRDVQTCYHEIIRAIVSAGESVILIGPAEELDPIDFGEHVYKVNIATNDTWIRDYGPLTLTDTDGGFILSDFRFNGWGQKFASNLDNQVNNRLRDLKVYDGPFQSHKDFVFEGGSIESDGNGTLLTTTCCLLAPNRNEPMTKAEIQREILGRLHARKLLWLDHGSLEGDDTDGHVDTLCRLAPGNTILYTGCQDRMDSHYDSLNAMAAQLTGFTNADGEPFNLIELPLPDAIYDEDGQRLPATYANYLVLEKAVLLPVYGQPMKDRLAADTLKVVYPDRDIICIDCRALIQQHGSLHCATMQIPRKTISFL